MADEVTVTTGVKVQSSVQPKLIIRTENSDIIFTAPYAPKEVSYYITGRKYNEVDRPDRKPITTSSGIALKQMSMELFVGSTNYETSVDSMTKFQTFVCNTWNSLHVYFFFLWMWLSTYFLVEECVVLFGSFLLSL